MLRIELLDESKRLVECILSSGQLDTLLQTAEEITAGIENPDLDVNLASFWKLDASIGGVGGYCLLSYMRPFRKPFPDGSTAMALFRPVQYAAAEIEYHNGPNTARAAVEFSGMHLEAVTKFWVNKTTSVLDANHYKRLPLGNSIFILKKRGLVADGLAERLDVFLTLHNLAKHEVTQDKDRDRMFSVADALVNYLSSRILSTGILKPYYDEILRGIPDYEKSFPGIHLNP